MFCGKKIKNREVISCESAKRIGCVWDIEFDEETGLYYFPGGYGGGYFPPVITEVRQNGNILEIDLEQYGAKDPATEEYFYLMNFETITIRFDDDGTWKYLSKKTLYTGYD